MIAVRPPMRVLLSGSSGLIGRHVADSLRQTGAMVVPLVRTGGDANAIRWDPMSGGLNPDQVSGFDVVLHLAGEPVGNGRWTPEKKRRIYESRVNGTKKLAEALARAERPPKLFLSASGINYYGDRGEEVLDEMQPIGRGFLAQVCEAWEAAADPLVGVVRVVKLRIGVVLAKDGGTLPLMLPLFRFALGGPVGGGGAYVSWVTMEDVVRAVRHVIDSERLEGALNLVSPNPVTNRAFTAALGAALKRPALVPVPGWAVRLLFGQLAEETVLSSVRAVPKRLLEDGFVFRDPSIASALEAVLRA